MKKLLPAGGDWWTGFWCFDSLELFSNILKVDVIGSSDLPMLALVDNISPILAVLMAVVIFAMIYNTAISMLLSFSARFMEMGTSRFRIFVIISGAVAFFLSFFGFTALVNWFYPVIGYLGLLLVGALVIADIRKVGKTAKK